MKNHRIWDVREFGAQGDGIALDTAAVQTAIDDCSVCGGGVVHFPAGTYLIGTLRLRSNITLDLAASAVLMGSARKQDYHGGSGFDCYMGSGFLLFGTNIENFAITGQGTIDGSGPAFWLDEQINYIRNLGPIMKPKPYRPRALLYIIDGRNIRINDVTFHNSPTFTVWLMGCDVVNIDRISIINAQYGPNTDGLDIDCCSDVRISDCFISAGDDAIALKSDADCLGRRKACENITVTNCTLSSRACGIRIGYEGDSPIKRCCFSNIVMRDTDIGVSIVSVLPDIPAACPGAVKTEYVKIKQGCQIEDIAFSNIIMENVNRPFHLWSGVEVLGEYLGYIRNISFSDIIAHANNAAYIGGLSDRPIESVIFSNFRLLVKGNMEGVERSTDPYHTGVWGGELIPLGIYLRNARNIKLRDVEICWEDDACGNWMSALRVDSCSDLDIDGFIGRQYEADSDIPAVMLNDVDTAFIHGCRSLPGTGAFLGLSGSKTCNITVIGNDFHNAMQPIAMNGLPDDTVFLTANRV
ncbi:MAG: glycosyl hydrolase family 28 protein [Armatimonadota bacterium]